MLSTAERRRVALIATGFGLFVPTLALLLGADNRLARWIAHYALLTYREFLPAAALPELLVIYLYWILMGLTLAILALWDRRIFALGTAMLLGLHIGAVELGG